MLTLRPAGADDVPILAPVSSEFEDFGIRSPYRSPPQHIIGEPGGLIVDEDGSCVGSVSWYRPQWGPGDGSRVFGIGIGLLPTVRGRGVGTWAQRELVRLIFLHTTVNRVEATTDVENLAEQKSLARAGFTREGVVRGAQWRLGSWHDLVQFSILRGETPVLSWPQTAGPQ